MIRKIPLLTLFFLFTSCVSSEEHWVLHSIGQDPYSGMSFTSNIFPKITLEFLCIRGKISSFLTLCEDSFVPGHCNTQSFLLEIDHQFFEKKGLVYEGNQRMALNEETTHLLIKALQENKSPTIEINGHKMVLSCHSFSEPFKKLLNKKKPWKFPFQIQQH
jgi:hypothetical protein